MGIMQLGRAWVVGLGEFLISRGLEVVEIAWVRVQGHGVGLVVRGICLAGGMMIKDGRFGWISSVRVNQVVILMGSRGAGLSCGTP